MFYDSNPSWFVKKRSTAKEKYRKRKVSENKIIPGHFYFDYEVEVNRDKMQGFIRL